MMSPWDLPNPGIKLGSPTLQADSLPCEPQGSFVSKRASQIPFVFLAALSLGSIRVSLITAVWTLAFSSETISSSIWSHHCPIRNPFTSLHHDQSKAWSPEHVILALESAQLPLMLSSTGPGMLVALAGGPPFSHLLTLFFLFFCFLPLKSILSFHTQVKCYLFCMICQWLKLPFLCS